MFFHMKIEKAVDDHQPWTLDTMTLKGHQRSFARYNMLNELVFPAK